MKNTKEAILDTALHLFARDGYEAVSVSQIAGSLGMTKGALYRHYKNKHDIVLHIVRRMEQGDLEQAGDHGMLLLYGSDQHQGKYDIDGTGCYQNRTSESSTDCLSEVLAEKY